MQNSLLFISVFLCFLLCSASYGKEAIFIVVVFLVNSLVFIYGIFVLVVFKSFALFFEDGDCVVDATFTFPTNLHISLAAFMAL